MHEYASYFIIALLYVFMHFSILYLLYLYALRAHFLLSPQKEREKKKEEKKKDADKVERHNNAKVQGLTSCCNRK